MPLSVPNSNGGAGLSGLLRQTRQAKPEGAAAGSAAEQPTTVALRAVGRSGIDSTQRGTAQIAAALTVYLSQLGGGGEPARTAAPKTTAKPSQAGPSSGTARSGAADLLQALDGYRSGELRLTG